MDTNTMKKLGWSQDLIDSVNNIKRLLDEGSVKDEPLMNIDLYGKISSGSASINTSRYSPIGHNYIFFKNKDS